MERGDREALKRLIEYARIEANEQKNTFTAYLLDLARRSVESRGTPVGVLLDISTARDTPEGGLQ